MDDCAVGVQLAQCHGKNVIYRDVKPDNFLFLTSDDKSPLKVRRRPVQLSAPTLTCQKNMAQPQLRVLNADGGFQERHRRTAHGTVE